MLKVASTKLVFLGMVVVCARAGETDAGFAVLADEIRTLVRDLEKMAR